MRERHRTSARYRVRRADLRHEENLERLDRKLLEPIPKPKRSYVGVYCPGCRQDVIPLANGNCPWDDRVVVLWDGTPIHERSGEVAA